jgi:hypothetical protein
MGRAIGGNLQFLANRHGRASMAVLRVREGLPCALDAQGPMPKQCRPGPASARSMRKGQAVVPCAIYLVLWGY